MTEQPGWPDTARAYDAVARDYAAAFADELAGKPADRALLDDYAAAVAGRGQVWDLGCGPAGHVTRYLADRGVAATGVDLSVAGARLAARRNPDVSFVAADLRALPVADGALAGIVAFYSVIHLTRPELPRAFAEFRRALAPGGSLLVAMHAGDGEIGATDWFGRGVEVRVTLVDPAALADLATAAGLTVAACDVRPPYPAEHPTERVYLRAVSDPGDTVRP